VDMCSIPLQQTNFTASDETMSDQAGTWKHVVAVACCPGKYGNKGERQVYTAGY
jgi:hypothetical protein